MYVKLIHVVFADIHTCIPLSLIEHFFSKWLQSKLRSNVIKQPMFIYSGVFYINKKEKIRLYI